MSRGLCSIEHCDREQFGYGWCETHYRRWYRHGDPLRGYAAREILDRIIDMLVLDENGCWLWQGACSKGYGKLTIGSRSDGSRRHVRVHRVTYEHFRGPIAKGLTLDHLCRVRNCANPWHCEQVSNRENVLRGNHPNVLIWRQRQEVA